MKIEGASYADIKAACGYRTQKYCRAEVREGLRQYWIADEEQKRQAISQAAGRLERAQRLAMKLMLDDCTEPRDVAKLMDSLTKLQERQSKLQALDIKPMPDDDGNAVDMWLVQIGGNVEVPAELASDEDDEPEDDDGLEDLDDE
ncbi:hypothetical protein IU433_14850 [Nocardia puris]|uniref:hypothetical protein n=1 Tax=Nocardia puris TaxID=208602 RepID=UPI001893EE57|nr:hypothetical protein [Nocardia puris]MBF6214631.1 hypothetical protein [Nocardia puris]MBF6366040.1 hypothetical protein [Nocardia puris]MBF6460317.1 hypothetical protein [Nocardia puris]